MVMTKKITKKIDKIKFSVLSPKEIIKQSVVKVITPEIYDKYGFPVEGGLMDLRMGVIEPGLSCKTCGQSFKNCEGHFGHLELARPVLNIVYIDEIFKILKSTCQECSRILIPDDKIAEYKEKIIRAKNELSTEKFLKYYSKLISNLSKVKTCPHCGTKQEEIKLDKSSVFSFTQGDKKRLLATEIRFRFENIIDDDLIFLNLSKNVRPEWLILTILPIPPVTMRSTITLASGQRSEDDLTHKLTDLIRTNQRLHEHLLVGVPETIIEDVWDLLQYHVSTYIDNTTTGFPPARHRNGDPLKSIAERIKGKKGIIRNNLIGKRVNFSARTVISPDPRLSLNEVGIPIQVAKKLTVPENVTEENIEYLKKLVKNGPLKYPGANYLITKTGSRKSIVPEILDVLLEEMEPGYIVERHILDGDSVIFNRQPSLHKLSMMGHIAKVLDIKTFAINPGVCKPYNADFDGDEMNLHMPQTLEARQEVEELMDVKHQLISPASGEAVIGCIQDSITGVYILTKGSEYSKEDALELLFSSGFKEINKINFKEKVTGAEIFSTILPEDLNFVGESKTGKVVIENGKLIEGIIDKKLIGDGGGTLLRYLHKHYGSDTVLKVVRYIFNLGIQVLKKRGFTISMKDFDINESIEKLVDEINKKVFKDIDKIIEKYNNGTLERVTGLTLRQTMELKMLQALNSIRDESMKIVTENIDKKSGTMLMADSGAMGKVMSIVQMHAGVGQQSLQGNRISRGFTDRTLSCFKRGDISPEARGYIKTSLRKGLKPYEVFFGAITGRDGLMDTALRTPKTGYLYRRMATAMLDLIVQDDLSVRNEKGEIVQFKYGDDGIDVAKTTGGKFDVKSIIENTIGGKL